jgi:membrane protein DedA with SNARE-associated domain
MYEDQSSTYQVLRVLITIPAGVNRMNVVTFTVISLIGTTIWNFGLILYYFTLLRLPM